MLPLSPNYYFLKNLGSKCETDDIEDDECEINSCTCRVISHQCFPQWSPEYYSDYGSEDPKQCRVDNKDCQIQPDPRHGQKTWTECDETLCFDEFGCKFFFYFFCFYRYVILIFFANSS